jgi:hypothetical protein
MPEEVHEVITNANHLNSEVEDLSVLSPITRQHARPLTASLVRTAGAELVFLPNGRGSPYLEVRASNPFRTVSRRTIPTPKGRSRRASGACRRSGYEGHLGQIDNILSAVRGEPNSSSTAGKGGRPWNTASWPSTLIGVAAARQMPSRRTHPFYRKGGAIEHMPRFHKKIRNVDTWRWRHPGPGRGK